MSGEERDSQLHSLLGDLSQPGFFTRPTSSTVKEDEGEGVGEAPDTKIYIRNGEISPFEAGEIMNVDPPLICAAAARCKGLPARVPSSTSDEACAALFGFLGSVWWGGLRMGMAGLGRKRSKGVGGEALDLGVQSLLEECRPARAEARPGMDEVMEVMDGSGRTWGSQLDSDLLRVGCELQGGLAQVGPAKAVLEGAGLARHSPRRPNPARSENMKSYATMLQSRDVADVSDGVSAEEELFTDADASYIPGRCGLNLKFSKRVLAALDRNWRYAVIVNLMGKLNSVNVFEFVLRGLRKKWLSSGCWKLIDLPKDYFVVNFELEEDMEKALCDGSWVLGGHTLIVRRWCATFNPLTDVVRSMGVWARVEGLPLRYFMDFSMTKIGKLIGEEVVNVECEANSTRDRYNVSNA